MLHIWRLGGCSTASIRPCVSHFLIIVIVMAYNELHRPLHQAGQDRQMRFELLDADAFVISDRSTSSHAVQVRMIQMVSESGTRPAAF